MYVYVLDCMTVCVYIVCAYLLPCIGVFWFLNVWDLGCWAKAKRLQPLLRCT